MVATTVQNSINDNDISLEQKVRNDLQKEKSFAFLNSQQQEALVKEELENRNNAINSSSDSSKDIVFQSRLDEELNTYIQFNSITDKEWERRFVHKHVQRIIDSGEKLVSLDPEDIIKQSVRLEVKDPEKRREEAAPKTENELIDELSKRLDEKDTTESDKDLKNLTKIYSAEWWMLKLRYSNLRMRRRTKRWVRILSEKTAEEAVLWMLSAKTPLRWWMITEYAHRWVLKLQDLTGVYKNPSVMNTLLSEKFNTVFKPVLVTLNNSGNEDDKKLAQQLLEKIKSVKHNYAIGQIKPLLELNKRGSSFTL